MVARLEEVNSAQTLKNGQVGAQIQGVHKSMRSVAPQLIDSLNGRRAKNVFANHAIFEQFFLAATAQNLKRLARSLGNQKRYPRIRFNLGQRWP